MSLSVLINQRRLGTSQTPMNLSQRIEGIADGDSLGPGPIVDVGAILFIASAWDPPSPSSIAYSRPVQRSDCGRRRIAERDAISSERSAIGGDAVPDYQASRIRFA